MIKLVLNENEWIDYIPEFMGNKDLPEDKQISCKIKFISQEEQDVLTDMIIGQSRDGFRNKKPIKYSKAHYEIVCEHVKDIKNVFVVKGGKEIAITKIDELYKIPQLKGLYSEIANALEATLSEAEVKN